MDRGRGRILPSGTLFAIALEVSGIDCSNGREIMNNTILALNCATLMPLAATRCEIRQTAEGEMADDVPTFNRMCDGKCNEDQ